MLNDGLINERDKSGQHLRGTAGAPVAEIRAVIRLFCDRLDFRDDNVSVYDGDTAQVITGVMQQQMHLQLFLSGPVIKKTEKTSPP